MKKALLPAGLLLILLGSFLLYLLVAGVQDGKLLIKSSYAESATSPLLFWLMAGIYAAAGVGNVAIGFLLAKAGLQRS